jgi:hypothetical protein
MGALQRGGTFGGELHGIGRNQHFPLGSHGIHTPFAVVFSFAAIEFTILWK